MVWIAFIVVLAALIALWEIQIEGKHGWAQNLPTWRSKNPLKKIFNIPDITGYHTYFFLFLIVVFHLPYLGGLPVTFKSELIIIQSFIATLLLEDFLWFVFNPAWGAKTFFLKEIPWHPIKIFGLPKNYWMSVVIIFIIELLKLIYIY
jgi:hypothetical protein